MKFGLSVHPQGIRDATRDSESIGLVIIESSTPNIHQFSLKPIGISLRKAYISGKLRFGPF